MRRASVQHEHGRSTTKARCLNQSFEFGIYYVVTLLPYWPRCYVICYYVVTLLPAMLLYSSLFVITLLRYCRRCYYFLRYITDTVFTSLVATVSNSVHG